MSEKEVFRNKDALLDINDKPNFPHWLVLSIQHLFTMFGATVLVPLLIGLNPSIALFCSGVGTIVYLLCTKAKIPAYPITIMIGPTTTGGNSLSTQLEPNLPTIKETIT